MIKKYKLFLEEIEDSEPISIPNDPSITSDNKEVSDLALNDLESEVKEYKTKKPLLDNIFKNAVNNKNLDTDIQTKVYNNNKNSNDRNRFLQAYEQILRIDLFITKTELSIERDSSKISEYNKENYELSNRSSETDSIEVKKSLFTQINKTNEFIEKLKTNINDNKKKLIIKHKELIDMKKKFDLMIQSEIKRLSNQ